MDRAKVEPCTVNICGDTIWLNDCGFAFDDTYFYVSPKNCDDNDKIARWELPKLKFWQKPIMQIRFKKLVLEITRKKSAEINAKYKAMELEKQNKVKSDLLKTIGFLE